MGRLVLLLLGVAAIGIALILLSGPASPPAVDEPDDSPPPRVAGGSSTAPASGVSAAPPTQSAGIRGRVLRPDDRPAPGAVVTLRPWRELPGEPPAATGEVRSDGDGAFSFRRVGTGAWLVRATQPPFTPTAVVVRDVSPGEDREVTLRLLPGRHVAGRVIARNGAPIPFARVRVVPGAVPVAAAGQSFPGFVFPDAVATTCGDDGTFRFNGLPESLLDIEAEADGHLPGRTPGIRPTADDLLVILQPAFEVRVRVTWEGDEPPDPVDVRTQGGVHADREKEEIGAILFRIGGLAEGEHRIEGVAAGFGTVRTTAEVGPGRDPGEVMLHLEPGTILRGVVTEEFGSRPVPDAEVELLEILDGIVRREPEPRNRVRTDEHGRYETVLGPGLWIARPGKAGYLPEGGAKSRFVHVDPRDSAFRVGCEPVERNLVLRKDLAVVGRVLYRSGRPAARSATVLVVAAARLAGAPPGLISRPPTVETDEKGHYRHGGLLRHARYTIRAFWRLERHVSSDEEPGVRLEDGEDEVRIRDLVLDDPPSEAPPGSSPTAIRGRILDHSGRPVHGAVVLTSIGIDATADDGRFEVEGVTSRSRSRLRVLAPGRPPATFESVYCPEGALVDVGDVVLPLEGIRVSGQVVDRDGNGIEGAEVKIRFRNIELAVRTDGRGRFDVEGPFRSPSEHQGTPAAVEAWAPGFLVTRQRASVMDRHWFDLVLDTPAVVKGRLVFPGPRPAWVNLLVRRIDRRLQPEWVPLDLAADGSFVREIAGPAHLDAVAAPGLLPSIILDRTAAPGKTVDLGKVRLHLGGTIIVRAVDDLGRTILSREEVRLARRSRGPRDGRPEIPPRRLDGMGRARFEGLPSGSYEVIVRPDRRPGGARVELKLDESREVVVRMP